MYNETRNCPECNRILTYANKNNFIKACNLNSKCRSCAYKKIDRKGVNNSFYGKKHSESTKEKIRKIRTGKKASIITKQKMSNSSIEANRKKCGKSNYQFNIEKYGKEEADKRLLITKNKLSIKHRGDKNPMYGKPAPNGSGNGWKGLYNGIFFRSLRELCFIINNPSAKSAEYIKIPYIDYHNNNRTYRPDFIISNTIIELKPKRLINSPLIKLKTIAAINYCNDNNLLFMICDQIIDYNLIRENINSIIFNKDYLEKFNKYNI